MKKEFKGYNLSKFKSDTMAGFTVTAVAIPLALAFAVSSGADASSGLICAIIGGIIIGALSGASYQISGPTGATAAILVSVAQKYSFQGVLMAGFIAGIFLLLAGLLRFGRLVNFIPPPVITGFTSGIAVIIAFGQIDNVFSVKGTGENVIHKLMSYFTDGFSPNLTGVIITLAVMAVMILWPKKWGAVLPASLAGIIIATALNMLVGLNVPAVGEIPRTLLPDDRLLFSSFDLSSMSNFITPALSIASLGMIESLLCGACAGRMKGEKLDADRELIAQGVGNLVLPFFGGIPATAAIARTSVAIKSGSVTRLTGIIHSLGILASMFLLAPVMSQIPLSALAGVLIITAWRMNEWDSIRYMFKRRFKSSIVMFLITMAATVLFDLSIAIIVGVLLSMVHFVIKSSRLHIAVEDVNTDEVFRRCGMMPEKSEDIKVIYLTGALFFANINTLSETLEKHDLSSTVIFSIRGVPSMDASSAHSLSELFHKQIKDGRIIRVCGIQPAVMDIMRSSGLHDIVGGHNIHRDALEAIIASLDADKVSNKAV
ncbi:MAG: SulP family inorganic anion transporter [Eubacteriales bacterium]